MAYQTDLPSRRGGGKKGTGTAIDVRRRQEKVDAEAEAEAEEEKDEVDDDDGKAAEGWKGTDLTSQMQEGAGGAFLGSGRAKKRGKNMGRPEEGKAIIWGGGGPQNSPGIFFLCRTAHSLV